MEDRKQEKSRIEIAGVGLPVPWFSELAIFLEFFGPNNLYSSTKESYWMHEKGILSWAFSSAHQHLGNPIDTRRIKEIYGLRNNQEKKLEIYKNDEFDLSSKRSKELVISAQNDNGGKFDPIMGNLVQKGLAIPLTNYEVKVENKETRESKNYKSPFVSSIMITTRGLIVGRLNYMLNKWYQPKNFRILAYVLIGKIIGHPLLILFFLIFMAPI